MNFPQFPNDGQVYTLGNRSWTFDAIQQGWVRNLGSSTGPTGPLGPTGPEGVLLSAIAVYSFFGDGMTTDFIINETPQSANNLLVNIDGLIQTAGSNFVLVNVAGGNATVRFLTPPIDQSTIDITHLNTGSALPGPTGPTGTAYWTQAGSDIRFLAGDVLIGYPSSQGPYRLQVNGQIAAASGGVLVISDRQYKYDVEPIGAVLDLVNRFEPVQFQFLQNSTLNLPEGPQIGFIAQDLEKVLEEQPWAPNLVKSLQDGKMLDQIHLIPVLVAAVQELSAEVQKLRQEIEAK